MRACAVLALVALALVPLASAQDVCTVRIRPKTGSDTAGPALNLVEVWLYDSIGNTIARSALTFALDQTLDTGTTPSLFPASNCNDGNDATMCHSTEQANGRTLTITYPCAAGLTGVAVHNRRDCCVARVTYYVLEVLANGIVAQATPFDTVESNYFFDIVKTCARSTLPEPPAYSSVPEGECGATVSNGTCTATCAPGYTGSAVTTCVEGTWLPSWSGSCTPMSCPSAALPTKPPNAVLPAGGCDNTASGGSCNATCGQGFSGRPTVGCTTGSWAASWTGLCVLTNPCAISVPYCSTCRYQAFGTTTKAVCTSCQSGYAVKSSGRACWCAPGFFWNSATSACDRCGVGNWCAGAAATRASAVRSSCGANKITSTDAARSSRECVVAPGYGWTLGDATLCPIGSYNAGYNSRTCTRCPGGLTTTSTGANSSQACVAPPGYFMLRGAAVACAQGTYKATAGNRDCDKCPDGFTTAPGTVAAAPVSACSYVLPGYSASAAADVTAATAAPCSDNRYRNGTAAYSTRGVPCLACPPNMQTYIGKAGASSSDNCLVPPGFGWRPASGDAAICGAGMYNEGWNRLECKPCDGANGTITTAAPGAISSDQCLVPAGHGASRLPAGTLTGYACPADTYGRANATTGLVEVSCDKCFESSGTRNKTGARDVFECVVDPGFGYYDGQVLECEYGTWGAGGNLDVCNLCGEHYNTTANGAVPTTAALTGASSASQCAIAAGWSYVVPSDASQGLTPCNRGFYKDLIGNTTCTQCPNATTTTIMVAATELSDCNACRPGFGVPSGSIASLSAPSCGICTSGTYSSGYFTGGQACLPCPKPSLFTGRMVSRQGTATPEDCVPEFPTDGDYVGYQPWDIIPSGNLTGQAHTSVSDCQAACSADAKCQYFSFYSYPDPFQTGTNSQCFFRLAQVDIALIQGFGPTTSTLAVLFEVKQAVYAVYAARDAADANTVGAATLKTGTWDAVKTFCDATPACVGMAVGATANSWRAFSGTKWEGATGKVRVVGEALNSWVSDPTP